MTRSRFSPLLPITAALVITLGASYIWQQYKPSSALPSDHPILQMRDEKVLGVSTEAPSTSTPLPTSQPAAQNYIDRAITAANAGDYETASTILSQGIDKFPDDQQLRATKDYYDKAQAR